MLSLSLSKRYYEAKESLRWVIREMYFILICVLGEDFSGEGDEVDESDGDYIKLPGNLNSSKCYFLPVKTTCIYNVAAMDNVAAFSCTL